MAGTLAAKNRAAALAATVRAVVEVGASRRTVVATIALAVAFFGASRSRLPPWAAVRSQQVAGARDPAAAAGAVRATSSTARRLRRAPPPWSCFSDSFREGPPLLRHPISRKRRMERRLWLALKSRVAAADIGEHFVGKQYLTDTLTINVGGDSGGVRAQTS